jgi:hypothetical protein
MIDPNRQELSDPLLEEFYRDVVDRVLRNFEPVIHQFIV